MKKFFSGAIIVLLIGGISYATSINQRAGSVRSINIPNSAVVVKKTTDTPQSLNIKSSKAITTTLNANQKKTDDVTNLEKSAATERVSGIRHLTGNSLTASVQTKPQTNQETEALQAQLLEMRAQIEQLRNELSRKATTQDIQELNETVNNKLNNYVSSNDMVAEIASAQEETLNNLTNKINVLNSKINTVALDARIEEDSIKRIFNQSLDTELNKTSDDGKFYRFATKNELNTTKEQIATDVANKKAEAIATAAADATNKANAAQAEAISVAAADATNKANTAQTEAIAAAAAGAAEKYDGQINTLNTRIANVASGQIDETALKGHFDRFLGDEIVKVEGPFKDFATKDELNTKTGTNELVTKLSDRFAKIDDVSKAALEDKLADKFGTLATKDELNTKTGTNELVTKLSGDFAKIDDVTKDALADKLSDRFAKIDDVSVIALEDKLSDKFGTLATKDELNTKTGTNELVTKLSDRFAKIDDVSKAALEDKLSDKFGTLATKDELNTKTGTNELVTKLSGDFAKIDDVTKAALEDKLADKFGTLATKDEVAVVDNKFGDYTKTSGLVSVIDGKIRGDLANANSDLAQKFSDYTPTSGMTTAIATAKEEAVNAANTATDGKLAVYATKDEVAVVDNKFGDYTKTSGLVSVIDGKIRGDLANANSDLAQKFADYTPTSGMTTAIATAKGQAVNEAKTDAANNYATIDALNTNFTRLNQLREELLDSTNGIIPKIKAELALSLTALEQSPVLANDSTVTQQLGTTVGNFTTFNDQISNANGIQFETGAALGRTDSFWDDEE